MPVEPTVRVPVTPAVRREENLPFSEKRKPKPHKGDKDDQGEQKKQPGKVDIKI